METESNVGDIQMTDAKIVATINNIDIEKSKVQTGCKMKYPSGHIRMIAKKERTTYRALAPDGTELICGPYQHVKSFAKSNVMFVGGINGC